MHTDHLPDPTNIPRRVTHIVKCWGVAAAYIGMLCATSHIKAQEEVRPEVSPRIELARAKERLVGKLYSLRWIAFSPSAFDPAKSTALIRSEVERDLQVLADAGFDGLLTYSCARRSDDSPDAAIGFCDVPALAKGAGFKGCIVGIWEPGNVAEVDAAVEVARNHLVDAVCVGNEGLDVRYGWDKLLAVMADVRLRGGVPCTTTEQIEDYSFDGLRDPSAVDLILPNVHPVFQNIEDPTEAAEWAVFMLRELRTLDEDRVEVLPLLVKETGWPSRGMPYHTELNQQVFWNEVDRRARGAGIPYAIFESFDQAWKEEVVVGKNVGPHWGLFTTDRQPKLAAQSIPRGPSK